MLRKQEEMKADYERQLEAMRNSSEGDSKKLRDDYER